jgi:hypothetical protein
MLENDIDALPTGWFMAGTATRDRCWPVAEHPANGPASVGLEAAGTDGDFGTVMQHFQAWRYRGKRVRFCAEVRTDSVDGWAGIWMRIDDQDDRVTAFDNMAGRPIRGSTDWTEHAVVLDVAMQADLIALGLLLDGNGRAWMRRLRVETVDASVPTTDQNATALPDGPVNLELRS